MCGILGFISQQSVLPQEEQSMEKALKTLEQRGPDHQGYYTDDKVIMGHSRLSIIDVSEAAHQPLFSNDKKVCIVYNGEFYNYQEERSILEKEGVVFKTKSDTEVLLEMYLYYGNDFIKRVNGCFGIAIYNSDKQEVIVYRDRLGIKPVYLFEDNGQVLFASETKAIYTFLKEQNYHLNLNESAVHQYFRFNYIASHQSIFKNTQMLAPGSYALISNQDITIQQYYKIDYTQKYISDCYETAQKKVVDLIDEAVKKRLIADVPLGTFLSGGIDSSIVSTLAARHSQHIESFSIGYADEPFFDETKYAELVAKKINSNHHTFSLRNQDLFDALFPVLDYLDEPFADSSAIAVYLLSKETKKYVTVALSGDGADEIFSGYHKHLAHYKSLKKGSAEYLIQYLGGFANLFSENQNSRFGNLIRQIKKFHKGVRLNDASRYIEWMAIQNSQEVQMLLNNPVSQQEIESYEQQINQAIGKDFNDILYSDVQFLLPNDMLYKVDKMSMANSLEVRTPFLDHQLVDYVFYLPSKYKINRTQKKRLLQDAFRSILPEELYHRPKHGFEVPLLNWFRGDLNSYIFKDLLSKEKIQRQKIFNYDAIQFYQNKLHSNSPGNVSAKIWALIVFQYWYDKHFEKK